VLVRAAAGAVGWDSIRRRRAAQDSLLATAEEALRSRFDAGQARYLDVLRLRTERLRVTAALVEAQAEADGAAAALLQLAGDADGRARLLRALAAARNAPQSLGPLPAVPDPDSLVEVSVALALARAEEDRLRAERTRVLADRHTQGSAFAGIQRIGGAENGAVFGPTLGVTLSLPFLTSGATNRRRAAADSTVASAEARTSSIKAAATSLLSAAVIRFAGARQRAALMDAALLRGALEERDVALANHRAGTLSLLELLDFERALVEADIGRSENLILAADAWADLLEAQAGEPSTTTRE
jgi:outer membrane protein TolC